MTAFEIVFSENKDFVYRYLLKLSHRPDVAEELTQETFFRAYMNFPALRKKEKAPAWLCTIAKNAYFAWYNDQKRFAPLDETGAPEAAPPPEDTLIRKELSAQALACLYALDEPYKEVFTLAVFGEVPLREISALFGKSESWARVTFYRAKQKLKEGMLQNDGL